MFPPYYTKTRAQKRLDGEDVFGRKITVSYPNRVPDREKKENSPSKTPSARKLKYNIRDEEDAFQRSSLYNSSPALNVLSTIPIPNFTIQNFGNGWHRTSAADELKILTQEIKTQNAGKEKTPDGYRRIKGAHRVSISEENMFMDKKCRTPSPYFETEEDLEHYFHPISTSKSAANSSPVELQVTNLDQNIDAKELKQMLLAVFREHVMVLQVSVFVQSDGNYAAHVKVPSLQDAQYAISQLHRRKVGYKRIQISYANNGGPSPQLIRSQIISLLLEVPGHRLPLFKFRELFESRYLASISVSDMYKMKDVCLITEESTGRMVILNPDHRNTPSPCFPTSSQDGLQMELPYCTEHSRKPSQDKGWAEQELGTLPNVRISLKEFALHIHTLLQTHNGSLPLPSLPNCYEAQYNTLPIDDSGVPLEHLVSCLPGIEIYQGIGCVKYLRWLKSKANGDGPTEENTKCVSPSLATQLALFSRELVDLLKTSPHSQLLFNRFIPAYHHHFGRQCRVADYGFTRLIDLLDSLPHIVQVMGEGNKRVITLSHRAQVRRFTSDLLRVLKSQASKQVLLSEFPIVYQKVLNRQWDVVDYGVCELKDILSEVSENTVVMTTQEDGDVVIAIPKREQTPEEMQKTKQFAAEVVELLRHAPHCSMQFNKFIPAYHHHYGHQCRVSDYGFTKLIELFEAIPHVVKVEEDGEGERKVMLTIDERLRVLADQISSLLRANGSYMSVSALSTAFVRSHGYALRPVNYECKSMEQLLKKLNRSISLTHTSSGPMVSLVDRARLHHLSLQARRILMEQSEGKMSAADFQRTFWYLFHQMVDLSQIEHEMYGVVKVTYTKDETMVELTPVQQFARNVYLLLLESDGRMPLVEFELAYLRKFQVACQPAHYGHISIRALLQSIPEIVLLRGKSSKKMLVLNKELANVGLALPASMNRNNTSHSDEEVEKVDPATDKFLKSVLSLGSHLIFDSPDSKGARSPAKAYTEKNYPPVSLGSLWGGASPPHYSPYCYSNVFSTQGGRIQSWPKPPLTTANVPRTTQFPFPSVPIVVPPDPSELPLPQMNGSRPGTRTSASSEDDRIAPSVESPDVSLEGTPSRRRKRRLAAQFNTPIEMP